MQLSDRGDTEKQPCKNETLCQQPNNCLLYIRTDKNLFAKTHYGIPKENTTNIKEFNMDQVIEIRWDFTKGDELSYSQGKECKDDFATNCLEFFSMDNPCAYVVRMDNKKITVQALLKNDKKHINKEMRKSHNIRKMLVSGAFEWV